MIDARAAALPEDIGFGERRRSTAGFHRPTNDPQKKSRQCASLRGRGRLLPLDERGPAGRSTDPGKGAS